MRLSVIVFAVLWLGQAFGASAALGQTAGVREVTASDRSLIPLSTKVRYTTMILLPEGEEILDVICGDRDFWVISATQNIAHVKPAKEGAATNLNLVTNTGTVYSFLLSESKALPPDLKVYVAADPSLAATAPKYYSANEVNALHQELAEMRAAVSATQERAQQAAVTFRQQYPAALQFPYGTPKYEKPFLIRSIWNDGEFTYIKSDATELPALYEMKDGQPSLVNFQVQSGTYVVPKILDSGYLALGKEKFSFERGR